LNIEVCRKNNSRRRSVLYCLEWHCKLQASCEH